MYDFFLNYAVSNIVCLLIFGIMLAHDLFNKDRQEKQIKYDNALIAYMSYFVSDTIWAAILYNVIPKNAVTSTIANFVNYIIMAAITYTWLKYVMAVEQVPNRNRKVNKFAVLFPFFLNTLIMIVLFIFAPGVMINESFEPTVVFYICQISVPIIYIFAVIFYALRKVREETNLAEKRKHIYIGFFPLIVVVGGIIQLWVAKISIFCFSCTLLMLIFYIQSMESQISVDPLTGLNNRGQLHRFIEQSINIREESTRRFVLMIDVNDFKKINDTYGHAEGDTALVMIAESLKSVLKHHRLSSFLGRYGGDEFILVLSAENEEAVDAYIKSVRSDLELRSKAHSPSYPITLGIGYDEWTGGQDSFQECMKRADVKLYKNKEEVKRRAANGKEAV